MVAWVLSRAVLLVFGMLYPAYASYKAVKSKNIREYVRWMMYWIVFALFMATETVTDIFLSWLPFYYEVKMAFVLWLLSPYTRGSSLLYRKFVHPTLARREQEIDTYIVQARERGYEAVLSFGKRGLNIAATAAVQAAAKSQGALAGRLRSFSIPDLRSLPDDAPLHYRDPLYLEGEPGPGGALRTPWPGALGDSGGGCTRTIGWPLPRGAPPRCDSEEEEEEEGEEEGRWSDSQLPPEPPPQPRDPKPISRSQSLRTAKKKPQNKEGSSRLVRGRIRKKPAPTGQED
uniref:Receptor expression-enhancing protein n=1 Tax=Anas platyrhynchos TaxID=8839 RepID=A0A8B9R011_ANAPL